MAGGVNITYFGSNPAGAAAAAAAASVAIVVVSTPATEGSDRSSLRLLQRAFGLGVACDSHSFNSVDQPFDDLVAAVAAAQPNTIVVAR